MRESSLEKAFVSLWRQLGHGPLFQQFKFHAHRKWKFDFAEPSTHVAIELEGVFCGSSSGHRSVTGILRDIEKYNEATFAGWAILRFTARDLRIDPVGVIDSINRLIESRRGFDLPLCQGRQHGNPENRNAKRVAAGTKKRHRRQ